jgi:predicted outer membrane repeat protein
MNKNIIAAALIPFLLTLTALALLTPVANAATFNVSTTPSLRDALSVAATNGEDDTIILADGTYKTTDDGEGTFIYSSNENNGLTLQGSSSDNVVLSGDKQHQIYNHESVSYSPLKVDNLSFIDGNSTSNGGAIYSSEITTIENCNFYDNHASGNGGGVFSYSSLFVSNSVFSRNTASAGGGFYTNTDHKIESSYFSDNISSGSGGGFFSGSNTGILSREIIDSQFINNTAGASGGGFFSGFTYNGEIKVTNSVFNNNSANSGAGFYTSGIYSMNLVKVFNSRFVENNASFTGGGFSSNTRARVFNSIFSSNISTKGGSFTSQTADVKNSLFFSNSDGIYLEYGSLGSGSSNVFVNSIFSNIGSEIHGDKDTIIISALYNNYLDVSKVMLTNFPSNNIYNDVVVGFVDEANGNYLLTEFSGLINAGINDINNIGAVENQFFPETDMDGNYRISGATIDIGPYELSDTRPTINTVTYSGVSKEQSELTFTADYILADGRYVNDVSYDFMNDGNYTSLNIYTYNTAGTYTVGVKVTDSEGEFSTNTTTVTIAELPFNEMTYEQKLIKAIPSAYYDDLLADIALEQANAVTAATTSGIATGKQYVQDNLSEFSLVTEAAFNANSDLDGDGYTNEYEVDFCSNPFDSQSVPKRRGLSPVILKAAIDAKASSQ